MHFQLLVLGWQYSLQILTISVQKQCHDLRSSGSTIGYHLPLVFKFILSLFEVPLPESACSEISDPSYPNSSSSEPIFLNFSDLSFPQPIAPNPRVDLTCAKVHHRCFPDWSSPVLISPFRSTRPRLPSTWHELPSLDLAWVEPAHTRLELPWPDPPEPGFT